MTIIGAIISLSATRCLPKVLFDDFSSKTRGCWDHWRSARLAITGACVHTFFDVYLKAHADELDNLQPSFQN